MYKYFADVKTLDELKAAYRRLTMQHHPDKGGDLETIEQINAEHDAVFVQLKAQHNAAIAALYKLHRLTDKLLARIMAATQLEQSQNAARAIAECEEAIRLLREYHGALKRAYPGIGIQEDIAKNHVSAEKNT